MTPPAKVRKGGRGFFLHTRLRTRKTPHSRPRGSAPGQAQPAPAQAHRVHFISLTRLVEEPNRQSCGHNPVEVHPKLDSAWWHYAHHSRPRVPLHKEGKGWDRDRPRPKPRVHLPITGRHHLETDPKKTSNHPAGKITSPKSQQFTSGTTSDDSPDCTFTVSETNVLISINFC